MTRIIFIAMSLIASILISCTSYKAANNQSVVTTGSVEFDCTLTVGDKPFHFDSTYKSPAGEVYSVNNIKFFISEIAFSRSNTPERAAQSDSSLHGVYLVDFSEAKRDSITGALRHATYYTMQTGAYSDVRFNIGVPRALNHSDPTQAPYPLNVGNTDMFWEWNSGYIFFLLEGISTSAEDSIIHLAIGGDSRIMPIGFGDIFNAVPLIQVKENMVTRVSVKLDLNKAFINPDGSFYSFRPDEASVVHGGKYADILRLNLLQSIEFVSAESIPIK